MKYIRNFWRIVFFAIGYFGLNTMMTFGHSEMPNRVPELVQVGISLATGIIVMTKAESLVEMMTKDLKRTINDLTKVTPAKDK